MWKKIGVSTNAFTYNWGGKIQKGASAWKIREIDAKGNVARISSKSIPKIDLQKHRNVWLRFVAQKTNRETFAVLKELIDGLQIPEHRLKTSGTKDVNGTSCQFISVRGVPPQKILDVSKSITGLDVGNFEFHAKMPVHDVKKNEFEVTIQNVDILPHKLESDLSHFQQHGFLNFFGGQRFRVSEENFDSDASEIGRLLLHKSWKRAVFAIMQPRVADSDALKVAKQTFLETKNPLSALFHLPDSPYHDMELTILRNLSPQLSIKSCETALKKSSQSCNFNVQAFYSWLWNEQVSTYVENFQTHYKNRSEILLQNISLPILGSGLTDESRVMYKFHLEKLDESLFDEFRIPSTSRKLIYAPEDVHFELTPSGNVKIKVILEKRVYISSMLRQLMS